MQRFEVATQLVSKKVCNDTGKLLSSFESNTKLGFLSVLLKLVFTDHTYFTTLVVANASKLNLTLVFDACSKLVSVTSFLPRARTESKWSSVFELLRNLNSKAFVLLAAVFFNSHISWLILNSSLILLEYI